LLDFLVVAFLELFLAAFFLAMALSPPFVSANLRVVKIKVNVFLRPRRFFLDALFALALPRASTHRAPFAGFVHAHRARLHVAHEGEFITENTEDTESTEVSDDDLIVLLSVSSVFSVAPSAFSL
jgi:hypothetical protein